MNKFSDWSAFEINKSITANVYGLHLWEYSETHTQPVIDYCNSWADMGPLIESAGITIGPCTSGGKMAACYRGGFDDITAFSGRTLRAAAEVYLMVKGAA